METSSFTPKPENLNPIQRAAVVTDILNTVATLNYPSVIIKQRSGDESQPFQPYILPDIQRILGIFQKVVGQCADFDGCTLAGNGIQSIDVAKYADIQRIALILFDTRHRYMLNVTKTPHQVDVTVRRSLLQLTELGKKDHQAETPRFYGSMPENIQEMLLTFSLDVTSHRINLSG